MHNKARLSGFHTHKSACKLSLVLLSYCCSKIDISRVKGGCHAKWMDWVFVIFRRSSIGRDHTSPSFPWASRGARSSGWRCCWRARCPRSRRKGSFFPRSTGTTRCAGRGGVHRQITRDHAHVRPLVLFVRRWCVRARVRRRVDGPLCTPSHSYVVLLARAGARVR